MPEGLLETPTILVADDELTVRSFVRGVLAYEGFRVVEAVDGVDALDQLRRMETPVDLLLTDIRMPRMDGVALARSFAQIRPGVPVLFISGYPFELDAPLLADSRLCASLAKPFSRKALLGAVRDCLSPPRRVSGVSG